MSFIIAGSIQEILDAMTSGARPVAGGSDLVVGARQGNSLPEALVAIDRVDELAEIAVSADGIRIGAGVTHATVMGHAAIVEGYTDLPMHRPSSARPPPAMWERLAEMS